MEKKKFYYNPTTYEIERRAFYDEVEDKDLPFIELTFEEWEEKLSSLSYGYKKVYLNGEIQEVLDEKVINTIEYKNTQKEWEIKKLKRYLNDTDYIITKLNEAKIEGDELFDSLKEQYAEVLIKRKEARNRINELEK
ncbi:MAG: hypothetical protein SPI36_03340 [Candidatus Onthovivens sp.]|nr:hypothetical protein [Candidatus Onthovivens sp.]